MLDNNYAEKATNCEESNVWFIPHYHGVYHPLKPKKICVVFDCSARVRGVSLSDNLLQGPDLTNSQSSLQISTRTNRDHGEHTINVPSS